MTIKDLAKQIPDKFRTLILEDNLIVQAMPIRGNVYMEKLVVIYLNYLDPGHPKIEFDNPCLKCYGNIIDKFRTMQPIFIELEKEKNLIASI